MVLFCVTRRISLAAAKVLPSKRSLYDVQKLNAKCPSCFTFKTTDLVSILFRVRNLYMKTVKRFLVYVAPLKTLFT